MKRAHLTHSVRFLSAVLKHEFVYNAATSMEENLTDSLTSMAQRGVSPGQCPTEPQIK